MNRRVFWVVACLSLAGNSLPGGALASAEFHRAELEMAERVLDLAFERRP
jgi:hypothetical protein